MSDTDAGSVLLIVLALILAGLVALALQVSLSAPTAADLRVSHPLWSAADCERVADHQFWIGMTTEMASASLGRPTRVSTYGSAYGIEEQWVYDAGLYDIGVYGPTVYLYFVDGVCTNWSKT